MSKEGVSSSKKVRNNMPTQNLGGDEKGKDRRNKKRKRSVGNEQGQ